MRVLFLGLFFLFLNSTANAEEQSCRVPVATGEVIVVYDDSEVSEQVSLREAAINGARYLWPKYWFEEYSWCDGQVAIEYLGRSMGLNGTEQYCLEVDASGGWTLTQGERNFRGRCKKSVCAYYQEAGEALGSTVTVVKTYALGTKAWAWLAGLDVVKHSSGGLIRTKYGKFLARTLNTYGTKSLHLASKSTWVGWTLSAIDLAKDGVDYACGVE